MAGEVWFSVLADSDACRAAARLLRDHASQTVEHASGRPWLLGQWSAGQLTLVHAGTIQVALIGPCPPDLDELTGRLASARTLEEVEQIADRATAGRPGAFHLVISAFAQVSVRGTASATRRVFHTRLAEATVAASRSDVLATTTGAGINLQALAARLLRGGTSYPLEEHCVYDGITALTPDHRLILTPDGAARTRRWWQPPEPTIPYRTGVAAVREALRNAVDARSRDGGTISADLSGGLDSTSLCFLAAAGPADLITMHRPALDPANDDHAWARRASEALPRSHHITCGIDDTPGWYADIAHQPAAPEPPIWCRDTAMMLHTAARATAHGSRLHLIGGGGDELFTPHPNHLHDLIRSHPLTALRRIPAYRAHWRRPLSTMLRDLIDRTSYPQWFATIDKTLTALGPETHPFAWGPELRVPSWLTPYASEAITDLLARTAAAMPPPLAQQRAQHTTIMLIRSSGDGFRLLEQAMTRAGLPYAAPYLDDALINTVLAVRLPDRAEPTRYKPLLTGAMNGIVPTHLLQRTTKGDYSTDFYTALRQHRTDIINLLQDGHLTDLGLIDPTALRTTLLTTHPQPHALIGLDHTLACETWLQADPTHRNQSPHPPRSPERSHTPAPN